jgi:Spherulation-specific family 4
MLLRFLITPTLFFPLILPYLKAEEPVSARIAQSQHVFQQSQQPTGLLIPLYHYPANIHTNEVFNQLINLKKTFPSVPVCAILNPANGPGEGGLDANYIKAVDRLYGAGVVMLGYVSTRYAKQPVEQVQVDIHAWRTRYPKVSGLFLDEMSNQPDEPTLNYYKQATAIGHDAGFWPVFANPGTATPEPFFAQSVADVFIIHENRFWPKEADLQGDYFGGYADYPTWTRGWLIHSQPTFDRVQFAIMRKHVRWVYVTHDVFDETTDTSDPKNNPWDELSKYLEQSFRVLSQDAPN